MLSLLAATTLALAPQSLPEPPSNPQQRCVDFSKDLDNPFVTVVIARVGKVKEGQRVRMKDGKLGGPSAAVSMSGTQFFKVRGRARLEDFEVLGGAALPKKPQLEFEIQLARLSDGSEHRQFQTGTYAPMQQKMLALWVVEKPAKGRYLKLRHVIPFHAKADSSTKKDKKGVPSKAVFRENMLDFYAVNRRIADLRLALAETKDIKPTQKEAALERLRDVAAAEVQWRRLDNELKLAARIKPFLRKVGQRIAKLEK